MTAAAHTPSQRQEYAARYAHMSRKLLQQAESELNAGDTQQASEKVWGAAAQAIKSLAESRGWNHQHHGLLRDAIMELCDEQGRRDLIPLYNSAHLLHSNYYEHEYSSSEVHYEMLFVQELIDHLEALHQPPPHTIENRDRDQRRRWQRLTDPARAHERSIPIAELPEVWPPGYPQPQE